MLTHRVKRNPKVSKKITLSTYIQAKRLSFAISESKERTAKRAFFIRGIVYKINMVSY